MGVVGKILSFVSPIASLFGGFDEEEPQTQTVVQQVEEDDDTTQTAEEQEKARKNALIQANAGTQNTSPLVKSEDTEVTKKTLLGL